jgi:hypothetical protein
MDKIEKLKHLKQLLDDGILSEEEFINMKKELLNDSYKEKEVVESQIKKEDLDSSTKETAKEVVSDRIILDNQIKKEKFDSNKSEPVKKSFEPPKKRTSQSASIWAVSIIIIVSLAIFFKPFWYDKFNNEDVDVASDNLKSWEDLDKFITKRADDWCVEWKEACAFKNKHKRWEEQLWVDGYVNEFILGGIPSLVRDNDLPDEFIAKADKLFNERMNGCGWYLDRTKWPGGLPSDNNENSQNIEIENSQNNLTESSTNDNSIQPIQLSVVNGKEYVFKDANFGGIGKYYVIFDLGGNQAQIKYEYTDYKENIGTVFFKNGQSTSKNEIANYPLYQTSKDNNNFYFYAYNPESDTYDVYSCEAD